MTDRVSEKGMPRDTLTMVCAMRGAKRQGLCQRDPAKDSAELLPR